MQPHRQQIEKRIEELRDLIEAKRLEEGDLLDNGVDTSEIALEINEYAVELHENMEKLKAVG